MTMNVIEGGFGKAKETEQLPKCGMTDEQVEQYLDNVREQLKKSNSIITMFVSPEGSSSYIQAMCASDVFTLRGFADTVLGTYCAGSLYENMSPIFLEEDLEGDDE